MQVTTASRCGKAQQLKQSRHGSASKRAYAQPYEAKHERYHSTAKGSVAGSRGRCNAEQCIIIVDVASSGACDSFR